MTALLERTTTSATETFALGAVLGRHLQSGDVLALSGALGAGKTQLVKGIASGLGVPDDEPVVSPTFVLMREYAGRLKLYHLDAYRLSGGAELLALGVDEQLGEPGAVVVIEWADRVADALPAAAIRIELAHLGGDRRHIAVTWDSPRIMLLARELQGAG